MFLDKSVIFQAFIDKIHHISIFILFLGLGGGGGGGGGGDPDCPPCQNVTEGPLKGMYYYVSIVGSDH